MITPIGGVNDPAPQVDRVADNLGRDEFLKLLVAQLQNQDPMNPMDGQEMSVQLAQFSSVEQLMQLNENFQAQLAANQAEFDMLVNSMGTSMLGNRVTVQGNRLLVPDDGSVTFKLPVDGHGATLRVFDSGGVEVATHPLGFVPQGRHDIDVSTVTGPLAPGEYSYTVEAANADGDPVQITQYASALIDGLRFGSDGLMLISGSLEIPIADVIEVKAP